MNTGNIIKILLTEKGKTQAELARALGVSTNAVNGWVKKGKEPKHDNLIQIAEFLGVSIDMLLGRGGESTEERLEFSLQKMEQTRAFCEWLMSLGYNVIDDSTREINVEADGHIGVIQTPTTVTISWNNDGWTETRTISSARFDSLIRKITNHIQIELDNIY